MQVLLLRGWQSSSSSASSLLSLQQRRGGGDGDYHHALQRRLRRDVALVSLPQTAMMAERLQRRCQVQKKKSLWLMRRSSWTTAAASCSCSSSAVDSSPESEATAPELSVESLHVGLLEFRRNGESLSAAVASSSPSSPSSSSAAQCENGASNSGEEQEVELKQDSEDSEESGDSNLDDSEVAVSSQHESHPQPGESGDLNLDDSEVAVVSSQNESHPQPGESGDLNLDDSEVASVAVSSQDECHLHNGESGDSNLDDSEVVAGAAVSSQNAGTENEEEEEKQQNNSHEEEEDKEEEEEEEHEHGREEEEFYVPVNGHRVLGIVVAGDEEGLQIDIGAEQLGHLPVKEIQPIDKTDLDKLIWKKIPENNNNNNNNNSSSSSSSSNDSSSSSNEQQEEPVAAAAAAAEDLQMLPKGSSRIVYDEEVLNSEVVNSSSPCSCSCSCSDDDVAEQAPPLLLVDIGAVLNLEVTGTTPNGIALLSARRAGRRIAWERIRQIKHCNEPIEIVILESLAAGVVTRIEGLRAFLPRVEFVQHPAPEPNEDLVGTKLRVLITVAEESRGNIILSEVRAWAQKHLCLGTVHDGTIVQIFNFGARVQINGTDLSGLVHISNIARARVPSVGVVFEVGEQVKVMAIKSPTPNKYAFSTADLESESGLMLRDKQRVFQEAEEVAKRFQDLNLAHVVESSASEPDVDDEDVAVAAAASAKPVKLISNWEWLDFGETSTAGVLL